VGSKTDCWFKGAKKGAEGKIAKKKSNVLSHTWMDGGLADIDIKPKEGAIIKSLEEISDEFDIIHVNDNLKEFLRRKENSSLGFLS